MMQVEIGRSGAPREVTELPDECVIGKQSDCELRLNSWRINRQHARLFNTPAGVFVEDIGSLTGVLVNGVRIGSSHGPVRPTDTIGIGPFLLRVLVAVPDEHLRRLIDEPAGAAPRTRRRASDQLESEALVPADVSGAKRYGRRNGDQQRALGINPTKAEPDADASALRAVDSDQVQRNLEFQWRQRLHSRLLEIVDQRRRDVSNMSDARLRLEADSMMDLVLEELQPQIPAQLDPQRLRKQVIDEAVGLGPLEDLFDDDSISEIMVNRFDRIYVERNGRLQRHPMTFTSDQAVRSVIERIVAPLGRHIDDSSPMVDARLKDGSRVNAIIMPLAVEGSVLTIRRFPKRKLTHHDLVALGALNQDMVDFLRICVEERKNIIIAGGTGAGKTTSLNVLSNFIPAGERVITVEDAAELSLQHSHLVSLEARPPNAEGKGAVTIRDLVRNVLRMRPDRVVIGECRGSEAMDMLQAMNTGHAGSLTTLHANSPRDALARLETMALMAAVDLPLAAVREQIASAIDIVVQQTRFACGRRVVTHITEVGGLEGGRYQLQDIFSFVQQGYTTTLDGSPPKVQGYFSGCDAVPTFYEELSARGESMDLRVFLPTRGPESGAADVSGFGRQDTR